MTDDIDAYDQIQTRSRSRTVVHPCRKCGMMIVGDDCPFCKKLKVAEPVKKTWRVGRQRV